jgi:hypothetical protein
MARSGTRSEMPDHGACWFSQGASQQRTRTWGSGGILTYARRIQRGTRCAYVQNVEPSWFRRNVSSGSTYA